jgi:hypothetical protein
MNPAIINFWIFGVSGKKIPHANIFLYAPSIASEDLHLMKTLKNFDQKILKLNVHDCFTSPVRSSVLQIRLYSVLKVGKNI